jgi:hypothetical protein
MKEIVKCDECEKLVEKDTAVFVRGSGNWWICEPCFGGLVEKKKREIHQEVEEAVCV